MSLIFCLKITDSVNDNFPYFNNQILTSLALLMNVCIQTHCWSGFTLGIWWHFLSRIQYLPSLLLTESIATHTSFNTWYYLKGQGWFQKAYYEAVRFAFSCFCEFLMEHIRYIYSGDDSLFRNVSHMILSSINLSINQSIDRSIHWSINQSINQQSINHSINQSIKMCTK